MALFDEFGKAFKDADVVIMAEIYAAREKNIHKISSEKLVDEIKKNYPEKEVLFFDNFADIEDYVYKNAEPKDLILTVGAGDVYKIGEELLKMDSKREDALDG